MERVWPSGPAAQASAADRVAYRVYAGIAALGVLLFWLSRSHPTVMPVWAPWDFSPPEYLATTLTLFWFVRGLAGIRPEEAGFARVTIRPQVVGDLMQVSASFDSIHGKISSAWRKEAGKVYLDVTVPANVTATVWVPTRDVTEVTESAGPVNQAIGVKYLRMEDGAAVYAVESGVYHFAWPQRQGG